MDYNKQTKKLDLFYPNSTGLVYHILEERTGQCLHCLARSSPENPGGRPQPAACFMRDKGDP